MSLRVVWANSTFQWADGGFVFHIARLASAGRICAFMNSVLTND